MSIRMRAVGRLKSIDDAILDFIKLGMALGCGFFMVDGDVVVLYERRRLVSHAAH